MPDYNPAYKQQRKQVKYKENRSVKKIYKTIDFLLNREEAHNTMFRQAFNKIQESASSQQDWGVTKDSRIYFDLSNLDGQNFQPNDVPPSFNLNKF